MWSKRRDDELEFLPAALEVLETPPRSFAHWLSGILVGLLVIALVWSIISQVDQVAVAQGQVVPSGRVQLIQPLEPSVIRAIKVRDGERVQIGQVLVELDPTEPQANIDSVRADLAKARLDAAAAFALLSETPLASFAAPDDAPPLLVEAARAQVAGEFEKLGASIAALDAEIAEQREQQITYEHQLAKTQLLAPLYEDRVKGPEDLHEKALARKPDLYAARQQVIDNRTEHEASKAAIRQAETRMNARRSKQAELRASVAADAQMRRAEALRKTATLEQQLKKEEQRKIDRALRSSVGGTVSGLSVFTIGGVVTTKDTLLRIVPEDVRLEVEVMVLNKDFGFIGIDQPAEVKIETFPFTRFGLIHGQVKQIWRDAINDDKQGLVYKAEITLSQEHIRVGDRDVPLVPGMSVQAEIKTGTRPVIHYFLSPFLRYRSEALRER